MKTKSGNGRTIFINKNDLIEYNKHADIQLPLDIKEYEIYSNTYGFKEVTRIRFIMEE